MLVVNRRIGQSVILEFRGIKVVVKVLDRPNGRGGQVSLGFDAPQEVDIYREELLSKKEMEDAAE